MTVREMDEERAERRLVHRAFARLTGRDGSPLRYALMEDTPVGTLGLAAGPAGLRRLLAADDSTPQKFISDLTGRVPDDIDELQGERRDRALMRLAFPGQRGWFYEEFGQKLEAMNRDGGFMADFRGILRRFDRYAIVLDSQPPTPNTANAAHTCTATAAIAADDKSCPSTR